MTTAYTQFIPIFVDSVKDLGRLDSLASQRPRFVPHQPKGWEESKLGAKILRKTAFSAKRGVQKGRGKNMIGKRRSCGRRRMGRRHPSNIGYVIKIRQSQKKSNG